MRLSVAFEGQSDYLERYSHIRLNCAIGYITSKGMLSGHQQEIGGDRYRKLEAAREKTPPAGRVTVETDYFRLPDNSTKIVG
jgi:hypothetical protein